MHRNTSDIHSDTDIASSAVSGLTYASATNPTCLDSTRTFESACSVSVLPSRSRSGQLARLPIATTSAAESAAVLASRPCLEPSTGSWRLSARLSTAASSIVHTVKFRFLSNQHLFQKIIPDWYSGVLASEG